MISSSVHCACYFAFLFICIDQGDGRWKPTSREKLERDILAFRKMTEKIQKEIAEFYSENHKMTYRKYSIDDTDKLREEFSSRLLKPKMEHNKLHELKSENPTQFYPNVTDIRQENIKENYGNYKSQSKREEQDIFWRRKDNKSVNDLNRTDTYWPKFEDILLAMGKRYDWKNDRWIKVKERGKHLVSPSSTVDNRMDFLSKHKFSYKRVKLNRSKTKRNLVIAVSAVR